MEMDYLSRRISDIQKQINSISDILSDMPTENLACSHDGKYYRYFYSRNGKQKYISVKKHDFLVKLAEKKYLCALQKDLMDEMRLLSLMRENQSERYCYSREVIADEAIERLLKEGQVIKMREGGTITSELKEWMFADYESNQSHTENLIHKGADDKMFRSKSEAIIDMLLLQNEIPYRYECRLDVGDDIFYPDFTLRHPVTGEVTYWEHFGQMDSASYVRDYHYKMKAYIENGIIPGINMIATYETKKRPFTISEAQNIIQLWLQK